MLRWRRIASVAEFDLLWPLLADAVGRADAERQASLRDRYLDLPDHRLYAVDDAGSGIGVIGVRMQGGAPHEGEIVHIAVRRDCRGKGYGRLILQGLAELESSVETWTAETDDDALGFYQALGFRTEDLGERYPGVRRYRCSLQAK